MTPYSDPQTCLASALDLSGILPDIALMTTDLFSSDSQKTERIEARVSPDFKQMVERAAALTGHTLSGFILYALQSSARKASEDHALEVLTAKESVSVAKALLHPQSPNAHLKAADARYRKLVKSIG